MRRSASRVLILGLSTVAIAAAAIPAAAVVRRVTAQYPTIQAAYDACSPGDTVLVASGKYYESLWLKKSGTKDAPITIRSAVRGGAIVDGQNELGANGLDNVFYIGGNHNVLDGFQIRNGYAGGIAVYGSYSRILHNHIHHNGGVYNNPHNWGQDGVYSDQNTHDNAYKYNNIHDNGRISLNSNPDHGMYLCGDNEVVANNLIWANCSYGLHIAGYSTVTNMKVYNNTFVGQRKTSGIMLYKAIDGIQIFNNIFYRNKEFGVAAYSASGSGVEIRNNLFSENGSGDLNMTDGNSTVAYTESGNITKQSPLFVNDAADFHLRKGSPAIDSGMSLPLVADDFDGASRPQGLGCDIGAYEFASKRRTKSRN